MKRAMLSLVLAFAFAACQDSRITDPVDGPLFAATKDCDDPKWQDHPACSGGNGDEDAYDATDLGTLPGKKNSSIARDLNEPASAGDSLLIVGLSENEDGDTVTTLWTVTAAGVSLDVLPVAIGFGSASVYGINDQGTFITGYADTYASGELVRLPARWDWNGSWQMTPLQPPPGYLMGISLNVNDQGQAVGWSTAVDDTRPVRVATLWNPDGTAIRLASPLPLDGVSRARHINNQGYIVGESWTRADAHPHAILWTATGAPCDLHLGDPQSRDPSRANGITDVFTDGDAQVVLVAGHEENHARVWKVSVPDCDILASWTMSAESRAIDVRIVDGGWEATVNDESTPFGVPMVWRSSGEHTILADQGMAIGINSTGQIVGRTRAKGAEHATLWTPKP